MTEVLAVDETEVIPIPVVEFPQKQAEDRFQKEAAKTVRKPESQYENDRCGFLVLSLELNEMLQGVVLKR